MYVSCIVIMTHLQICFQCSINIKVKTLPLICHFSMSPSLITRLVRKYDFFSSEIRASIKMKALLLFLGSLKLIKKIRAVNHSTQHITATSAVVSKIWSNPKTSGA